MLHVSCRHCHKVMQEFDGDSMLENWLLEHSGEETNFHEFLQTTPDGSLHLWLVCEECEDILTQNPNLFEQDYFIH
ncbi:anti-sigma-F factor Fin [Alkalibacillus salilacus]|uniref:DUF2757 family protein n=1 Tax=Alkalibacillus salilacus TaxID=284582 RepID=A0ABT9VBV4_9BACI|nr:anti-sigma-F factor Fin [Alkalibacillus salilacus]MDQ0158452.1 hypothetical protein [Alkalibacillus salilacus]